MPPSGAAEVARRLADALEGAGISYAIGGALALGVAGVPRGTLDVDINVFVPDDRIADVARVLEAAGVRVEAGAGEHVRRDGMFVGHFEEMRVDLFLPSIPFSYEAQRTRVRVATADGWSGWFLSAEAIALFKLLFFRGKDVVDLARLVAVRGDALDTNYVRRWIVEMMGEDDERVRRWDDIVGRLGAR